MMEDIEDEYLEHEISRYITKILNQHMNNNSNTFFSILYNITTKLYTNKNIEITDFARDEVESVARYWLDEAYFLVEAAGKAYCNKIIDLYGQIETHDLEMEKQKCIRALADHLRINIKDKKTNTYTQLFNVINKNIFDCVFKKTISALFLCCPDKQAIYQVLFEYVNESCPALKPHCLYEMSIKLFRDKIKDTGDCTINIGNCNYTQSKKIIKKFFDNDSYVEKIIKKLELVVLKETVMDDTFIYYTNGCICNLNLCVEKYIDFLCERKGCADNILFIEIDLNNEFKLDFKNDWEAYKKHLETNIQNLEIRIENKNNVKVIFLFKELVFNEKETSEVVVAYDCSSEFYKILAGLLLKHNNILIYVEMMRNRDCKYKLYNEFYVFSNTFSNLDYILENQKRNINPCFYLKI